MDVIVLENLTKHFRDKKRRQVVAIDNLTCSIRSGEIFGFLGPNGAGKSTTIKAIMGLIAATSGRIVVCGQEVTAPEARRTIGYLPENPSFYDFLTAREYLQFVGKVFAMTPEQIRVESKRVLELLGLDKAADRPIKGYSKGMVQRLGLAQALLHDPDVYVLDEPMSGLDPLGRALVKEIILDLKKQGKTVFFSTHITNDVEVVCDRVGIIVGGVLQSVADVDDLLLQGIEGYVMQVSNCPGDLLARYEVKSKEAGALKQVYVPRDQHQAFMEQLFAAGGSVALVDTRRKDLEAFFLDVVAKGSQ